MSKKNKEQMQFTATKNWCNEGDYELNIIRNNFKFKALSDRSLIGYCDNDVINMDRYLLLIIPRMLRSLAKKWPEDNEWSASLRELATKFDDIRFNSTNPVKLQYHENQLRHEARAAFEELGMVLFELNCE